MHGGREARARGFIEFWNHGYTHGKEDYQGKKLAELTTGRDRNAGGRQPFPLTSTGVLGSHSTFNLKINDTDVQAIELLRAVQR